MGDFFKSWRRKLGVVVLLLACSIAACWIRSVAITDSAVLAFAKTSWKLESHRGIVEIERFQLDSKDPGIPNPLIVFGVGRTEWRSWDARNLEFAFGHELRMRYVSENSFCGITLAQNVLSLYPNNPELEVEVTSQRLRFPYGLIEMPLVVLSAYLILRKSRFGTTPRPACLQVLN